MAYTGESYRSRILSLEIQIAKAKTPEIKAKLKEILARERDRQVIRITMAIIVSVIGFLLPLGLLWMFVMRG